MEQLSQIWHRIQEVLFPVLQERLDPLTEKQRQLIEILEVVRIEDYVRVKLSKMGRPESDRRALARAFVCKAVYNMGSTEELIDRLHSDKNLRRICGFERANLIPDESTFSRAFDEFAQTQLPTLVHAKLIEKYCSERLVGHIARDSTEIIAREKPVSQCGEFKKVSNDPQAEKKRGRPKKGQVVAPKSETLLEKQMHMSPKELLESIPTLCNRGSKKNSKGFIESWNGYKLHIDTADGGIPISCLISSASVHDSQVALPLASLTAQRVVSLYDLMDAAYDAEVIKKHSLMLGHVPIIDHNPRGGEKRQMDEATAQRYKIRTGAERVNARLKDEFCGRMIRVRGPKKVMAHLMFGILVLTADQLLRLVV